MKLMSLFNYSVKPRDYTSNPVTPEELKAPDAALKSTYHELKDQKKLKEARLETLKTRSQAAIPYRDGSRGALLATLGTFVFALGVGTVPAVVVGAVAVSLAAAAAVGVAETVLDLKADNAQTDIHTLDGQMSNVYKAIDPEPDMFGVEQEP